MSVSVCQLSVNESRGAVKSYTEWNCSEYLRYAHLPVKAHNDYYTISDVIANSQAINGDVISMMAVVKHVSVFLSLSLLCHVMNWPVILSVSKIVSDSNNVLHTLLPPLSTASQHYNLRRRTHTYSLPGHDSYLCDCNFVTRMLYKDSY